MYSKYYLKKNYSKNSHHTIVDDLYPEEEYYDYDDKEGSGGSGKSGR